MIQINATNLHWNGITIASAGVRVIRALVEVGTSQAQVHYSVGIVAGEDYNELQTFTAPFEYQGGDLTTESVIFVKSIFNLP